MDSVNTFLSGFKTITTPYDKVDHKSRNLQNIINLIGGADVPNMRQVIQDRMKMNITGKQNNSKPFESVQVAPGINQGYGTEGSGGFNSGLMERDTYAPKTVDDLRTKNNPKQSYGGVVLGGKSAVVNRGIHGKIEKNRPFISCYEIRVLKKNFS
mgnify:CR=1 FL=1